MTPKKIALALAPIAAFALGWSVRAFMAPPAEERAAVEVNQTPAGTKPPAGPAVAGGANKPKGAAGAANAPKGAGAANAPKGGGAANAPKGAGAANAPKGAGAANAPKGAGAAKVPNIATGRLALKLWPGHDQLVPAGTHIRLRPTSGIEQALVQLRLWAASRPPSSGMVELLSDAGALVAPDGEVRYDEVPAIAMTLDVWSETDAFEAGSIELGKIPEREIKRVQVPLMKLGEQEKPAASATAPQERRRDPAELVPFHALVLTAGDDPVAVVGASVQDRGRTLKTTDEEGRFQLPYEASLAPTVRVAGPGLGPAIVQVGPGHATPEEALVVRLRPSASMEVRILSADGRPVPGVRVQLSTDMIHVVGEESGFRTGAFELPVALGEITWTATTNNFGAAFLDGLPAAAPLAIVALRQGAQAAGMPLSGLPKQVTLAPGEKWTDEWRLPRRPKLRGRAVDHESQPIAGAPIWLVRSSEGALTGARYLVREDQPAAITTTEPDGSFVFEDLEPGVCLVGVGFPEAGRRVPWQLELDHLARPVEVPDLGGPELGEVLLRVGRGLTMRGVVLDPTGLAAAGVLVTALEDSGRGVAEARTDGFGEFALGPLSNASFRLIVAGQAGSGVQHFGPIAAGSRDLVLKLVRSLPLTGRVVSPAGDPRAATVAVFQDGSLRAQLRTLEPEQPGVFVASGLEPGIYDFIATTADGQIGQTQDVAVGPGQPAGAVRVPLATAGLLTVRHSGARPWSPFTLSKDGKPFALGILHRGVPRALYAPAGTITVRLESGLGPAIERSVEILAGEQVELLLEDTPASNAQVDGAN